MAALHTKRFRISLVLSIALTLAVAALLIWSYRVVSAGGAAYRVRGTTYIFGWVIASGRIAISGWSTEGEYSSGFAVVTGPATQAAQRGFRFSSQNGVVEVGTPLWLMEAVSLGLVVLCYRRSRRSETSRGFSISARPSDG